MLINTFFGLIIKKKLHFLVYVTFSFSILRDKDVDRKFDKI